MQVYDECASAVLVYIVVLAQRKINQLFRLEERFGEISRQVVDHRVAFSQLQLRVEVSPFKAYQPVGKAVVLRQTDVFADQRHKIVKWHHGTGYNEIELLPAFRNVAMLKSHIL